MDFNHDLWHEKSSLSFNYKNINDEWKFGKVMKMQGRKTQARSLGPQNWGQALPSNSSVQLLRRFPGRGLQPVHSLWCTFVKCGFWDVKGWFEALYLVVLPSPFLAFVSASLLSIENWLGFLASWRSPEHCSSLVRNLSLLPTQLGNVTIVDCVMRFLKFFMCINTHNHHKNHMK